MVLGLPSTASLARFCQKLNRLKTLKEPTTETLPQRHLTTLQLTLLGVGGMVGMGIYLLAGTMAKEMAGPALLVSFGVAAMASLLATLCYAEFAVRVPCPGIFYLFTYVSMGELWAFLIGWNVLFQCLIGGAAVARVCSTYLDAIFSHRIRSFTVTHVGIWQVPFLAQYPDFLAAGIAVLASLFITCGARVSSWLNYVFSAINLVIILFIIILGFVLARPHNWSAEEGGFVPFGFPGIMAGAATCFYAFEGFGIIAASSKEAQTPKRAVPMAITISVGVVAGAYILVCTVLTLMVPWHSLDPDSAFADAFHQRGYSWAGYFVAAGSICAMTSVLLRILHFLPQTMCAMAIDGLFFQVFAHMQPRTQDTALHLPPWGYTLLLLLSSATFLLSLLILGAHQQQRLPDTFQVPMVPLTPALSILLNIILMLQMSYLTWLSFSIWLLMGEWGPGWDLRGLQEEGTQGSRAGTCPSALCHPCRTRGVFWLWHLAQQGEPAGAAGGDGHTLHGGPQQQLGGDGAGRAAAQSGTGPGARPHRAAHQSMRTAGVLPSLPHLFRSPEGLAAPLSEAGLVGRPEHARKSSGPQDLSPGAVFQVIGSGPWPALVWWTLLSTFQFMTKSSYQGRCSRAGREEA
uniref:Cationic amino acid transporter C-terminal domain-containing protein n=1 Tax=Equus caballus TaxID=9796 RepID=A0A5F5PWJ4_HORSE